MKVETKKRLEFWVIVVSLLLMFISLFLLEEGSWPKEILFFIAFFLFWGSNLSEAIRSYKASLYEAPEGVMIKGKKAKVISVLIIFLCVSFMLMAILGIFLI